MPKPACFPPLHGRDFCSAISVASSGSPEPVIGSSTPCIATAACRLLWPRSSFFFFACTSGSITGFLDCCWRSCPGPRPFVRPPFDQPRQPPGRPRLPPPFSAHFSRLHFFGPPEDWGAEQ